MHQPSEKLEVNFIPVTVRNNNAKQTPKKRWKQLYCILNFIADPAVIIDEKGCFLVVNDAFIELTGLKKRELIGSAFIELNILNAEAKALLFENFAKRMKGVDVEPYEFSFQNRAGETRYAEVKAKKVRYSGHSADIVVFHDSARLKPSPRT